MENLSSIKGYREQGVILESRGEYRLAREYLEKCLEFGPQGELDQYVSALFHLGVVVEKLGEVERARDFYLRCIQYDSLHVEATRGYRRLSGLSIDERGSRYQESSIIRLPSRATRRGFLLLGYPCDLDCQFCYYHFKKKPKKFMSLDEAKHKIDEMKYFYGCNSVDISGGEPTLYGEIVALVEYCWKQGVVPSIITHGSLLTPDLIGELVEKGLWDFLVSLHAVGDAYDETVGKKRFSILEKNLRYMSEQGVRFRTNSVVSRLNIGQFNELAGYIEVVKPQVANFIVFNPGGEWRQQDEIKFCAPYGDYREPLHRAIALLEPGITVNVRFYPFCFMKGYEKNNANFPQQGYDPYEWSFYQKRGMDEAAIFALYEKGRGVGIFHQEVEEIPYNSLARRIGYEQNSRCEECFKCAYREVCSGFSSTYARLFGFGEARAFPGEVIGDPLYFRMQDPGNRVYGYGDHA